MTQIHVFPARESALARRWNHMRWTLRRKTHRWALAWRFATGRLKRSDAGEMLYLCQEPAGAYTLVSLDVDRVIEDAEERWEGFAELPRLAADACARVASRYEQADVIGPAIDWALDLIEQYAKDEGVALKEIDDIA